MKPTMKRDHERFDEELREWGRRPPRTSARQAAHELRQRLEEPRRAFIPPVPRLAAAVLAAVGVVALALWLVQPFEEPGPPAPPAPAVAEFVPPPLAEGVVLIWLDPKTPLYLTLKSPRPEGAEPGSPKGDAS